MRYDQLSGIIIKGFAAPVDSVLIRAVTSMITVSAFGCSSVIFVLCTRVSRSCDFIQEYIMPFCEMTEDSFDFHIVKIPTNHIFGFGMRSIASKIVYNHLSNCQAYTWLMIGQVKLSY